MAKVLELQITNMDGHSNDHGMCASPDGETIDIRFPLSGPMEIKQYIPWVRKIALKIHRPLPANIMLDDLIQDGMIGLIRAFREYDANSAIPFQTFVGNKIKWAIMDGLRAGDWCDKHIRRRANKVAKTTEKLPALLHRRPSKREIADELGVRVDDIATILGDAYGYDFVSIDEGFQGDSQDGDTRGEAHNIPDSRMEPSAIVERQEAYTRAVSYLKTLQANERTAFIMRNMLDMSGRQVATEMEVSESRVSQLYKSATEKLALHV